MNLKATVSSLGLMCAALSFAALASAQATGADKASAEALFNEGVSLVASGKYSEGCRKFEGSQGLDPTLGTELRLGDCYERLGKTASAWATFKHAQGVARSQNQSEREELARQRVEALEPKLVYLSLDLDGTAQPGLVVQRNGSAVPLASLGVAIPVDPGKQDVTASAPEHELWQETIEVAAGPGKRHLRIPPLKRLTAQPPASSAPPAAAAALAPARPQSTVGIITGAVGIAAILAGGGLGLYAKKEGERSKEDEFCPSDDHNGCTAAGVDLRDRARGFGTASTITFIAGAALLTTGIVLWATAGGSSEQPQQARLQLRAVSNGEAFATSLRGSW